MALYIKSDVDLKELEKFGFDDFGGCYKKYGTLGEKYFINKGTRKITRIHPFSLRETPTLYEMHDLIQANLVEEVEE